MKFRIRYIIKDWSNDIGYEAQFGWFIFWFRIGVYSTEKDAEKAIEHCAKKNREVEV